MKKRNLAMLILLLVTMVTYGQNDFKEIQTKTLYMTIMTSKKPMKSKNIIRIYDDKIEVSADESKIMTKVLSGQNLDGMVTTYNVKEVDNGNPKIVTYKGETNITIDYSGKKPKVKIESKDPNTGGKMMIIYQ